MKITIFGATGRTGHPLVEQALEQGHTVTAFVRDPSKLPLVHARLHVVRGDATDGAAVERAIEGQDAVLMVLGHNKQSPPHLLEKSTHHVLAAMGKHGVSRLISLTGAGVADPKDTPRLFNRVMSFLLKTMQGDLLADSEKQAELIRSSGLDWTIVRVPRLTEGDHTGQIKVGYVGQRTGPMISRADVADWLLRELASGTYIHDAPMISN